LLFSKEFLQEQVGEGVQKTIVKHSRWSVHYKEIFEHEGKYYRTFYSVGATESQDEQPYEYDEDMIECLEVQQVKKYMSVWEDVKS
jgi:hypothetical protein